MITLIRKLSFAPLAHLDRALRYERKGDRFESCTGLQTRYVRGVAVAQQSPKLLGRGSNPRGRANLKWSVDFILETRYGL